VNRVFQAGNVRALWFSEAAFLRSTITKIKMGFNIVPMWHPLPLAEDYAMLDILTGGQIIFAVGDEFLTALHRLLLLTKGRPVPIGG
jgi:hypothetical protein